MFDRVACVRCGQHRRRPLENEPAICYGCLSGTFYDVPPNLADVDFAIAQTRQQLALLEGVRMQVERTASARTSEAAN